MDGLDHVRRQDGEPRCDVERHFVEEQHSDAEESLGQERHFVYERHSDGDEPRDFEGQNGCQEPGRDVEEAE